MFRDSSKGLEYLMIQRNDSFGFVEFIRGKYPLHNEDYIQTLINEMTMEEKNKYSHRQKAVTKLFTFLNSI